MLHRGLGGAKSWVVPLAVAASALVFSWAHHSVGGEPWNARVFLFRAAMGALLGWIYLARGLGVVVYAHALYNVVLVVERHV
jgi:membrane protease YdiL (CAAX protease family)